jgi:hypothetical protein
MGDKPILYSRVKKAKKVNMMGAMMNSYSSKTCKKVCGFY